MSTRRVHLAAQVVRRERLSAQLVRLVLGGDALSVDLSTGIPDEWVGLVVPGQFQTRFYTVRSWAEGEVTVDVAVHDAGLVTDWATGDCVGDHVEVTDPQGGFRPPAGARWIRLVTDLTGLPATARICDWAAERAEPLPVQVWAEAATPESGYLPEGTDVTWLEPPVQGASGLAAVVEDMDWPDEPGYFWMAGESAQMRAIRKHLARDLGLASASYHVTGYWRQVLRRRPREVDPRRAEA